MLTLRGKAMFMDMLLMGEPQRLDYIIREHDELKRRVDALTALLVEKGIISEDALGRHRDEPSATESATTE